MSDMTGDIIERIDGALDRWALPSRGAVAAEWIETYLGLTVEPWQRRILEASFARRSA